MVEYGIFNHEIKNLNEYIEVEAKILSIQNYENEQLFLKVKTRFSKQENILAFTGKEKIEDILKELNFKEEMEVNKNIILYYDNNEKDIFGIKIYE